MSNVESGTIETSLFISRAKENKKLEDAVKDCGSAFHEAIALLYAPHKCFLTLVKKEDEEWRFYEASPSKETGEEIITEKAIDIGSVFEARVFNETAELRWLNKENGEGTAVVLCKDDSHGFFSVTPESFKTKANGEEKKLVRTIEQTYLLWGESVSASDDKGWAKFAEARIGSFFVPIKTITAKQQRARFIAIEYLGEYADGNVAIAEERLTGIEIV